MAFDNDAVPNNSLPAVNLTPSTPYDCRVHDASGNGAGASALHVRASGGDPRIRQRRCAKPQDV